MSVMTGEKKGTRGAVAVRPVNIMQNRAVDAGVLEGELADLYGAILIVVPVALFLKSLWT
jgi:hypothetical protein